MKNRTWVQIDLDSIRDNYESFKAHAASAEVMCVIKANAYGHGAARLGLHLQDCGCRFFGVASVDEAVELCRAGVRVPILVLNYTECIAEALKYPNIRLTVIDADSAFKISNTALSMNTSAKIHIKLDTGMTRVGFNTDAAAEAIVRINKLPGIVTEGLFTHFASADETDPSYTRMQFARYTDIASRLEASGIEIPIKHVCNSAAAIMYPEMHLDMVRVGISLYGAYPSEEVDKSVIALKPAMQLKTRVIRVNDVAPGVSISYGRIFTTARRSRIATIPVGYADGISRVMAGKLKVLVNGVQAPVVGKICMDQSMVDVTDVPGEVRVLDEITVYGEGMPVEDAAAAMGTINYEVFCMVGRRVPRHYTVGGKDAGITNYLVEEE